MNDYPRQFSRAILTAGYRHIGRPLAGAKGNPERAHGLGLDLGRVLDHFPRLCQSILGDTQFDNWLADQGLDFTIGNAHFRSPFVTPGGLLKVEDGIPKGPLKALPIGAATLGSITPNPRSGNPERPRVHVDESSKSIVNFMGLNGPGVDTWVAKLKYERDVLGVQHIPYIINISNDPGTAMADKPSEAKELARKTGPFAHVIEYNGACPNVGGGSGVQAFSGESLECLVLTLTAIHEGLKEAQVPNTPIMLKLPPHLDLAALDRVIAATSHLVSGYTCINTSPNQGLKDQTPIGKHKGGLSGELIFDEMIRTVQLVRQIAPPDKTIIALGGLGTGNTRQERFLSGYLAVKNGANFVSAYTSLALLGPWVMYDIIAGAVAAMKEMKQV